jgi:hypothetical protein
MSQLLYRSPVQDVANQGTISLQTEGLAGENSFQSVITQAGAEVRETLPSGSASLFSERCYLPQSLLGQLLQIYQESDSSPDSPLSRFVTELLGLDRLDAIETGLAPVGDVRNLRKTTERYGQVEYEKAQLERSLAEHRRTRDAARKALSDALSALDVARANLGLSNPVDESTLAAISVELGSTPEEATLSHLHDQRRRLEAIAREAERNTEAGEQQDESALAAAHQAASERLRLWQQQFEGPIRDLRARVARVLPNIDGSRSDTEDYQRLALAALREQKKQAEEQSAPAARGARRQAEVADELSVARRNLQTVDEEIGRIATNSGSLAAILAELTSLISTDVCPVCDRDFTEEGNQPPPSELDTPQGIVARFLAIIEARTNVENSRTAARSRARDSLGQAIVELARRKDADDRVAVDEAGHRLADEALSRAARIRADAQVIKSQVETVRSRIIGKEFNDRLNRLWRDLFVRLAPNEPYVPAFRVPTESTRRLQPKLITTHRSGGAGGTPGAMLSAGNLNTAALTLFIALHLTVAEQLPWLILDDPVQSMDDVHIAHFAALLRTLSKQHRRQIIIAVHDRQLFEYLKLELGPAFEGDSLRTLELSGGPATDTLCLPERRSFRQETALRFVA